MPQSEIISLSRPRRDIKPSHPLSTAQRVYYTTVKKFLQEPKSFSYVFFDDAPINPIFCARLRLEIIHVITGKLYIG